MTASKWLENSWQMSQQQMVLKNLKHGDLSAWLTAIDTIPKVFPDEISLDSVITARGNLTKNESSILARSIKSLRPWRKGPFHLFDQFVNSEWRSDYKWKRIQPALNLTDHRVLDVGSGNGYYGWRMLSAGADLIHGLDPNLLFCCQHALISYYLDKKREYRNTVIPLRFEDFKTNKPYDTAFSMGVLYHRRDYFEHLIRLFDVIRSGGTLVLESLIAGDLIPTDRYARMRNVWFIPSEKRLYEDLVQVGFENPQCINMSLTRVAEQRTTFDMPNESLVDGLDQHNPLNTIEGHPSPIRAVFIAKRP